MAVPIECLKGFPRHCQGGGHGVLKIRKNQVHIQTLPTPSSLTCSLPGLEHQSLWVSSELALCMRATDNY